MAEESKTVGEFVGNCLEYMWDNVIEKNWNRLKVKSWSLRLKRLYLFTLPLAFPIHMTIYLFLVGLSIATLVAFLCVAIVLVAPIEFYKAMYKKFWLGETDD